MLKSIFASSVLIGILVLNSIFAACCGTTDGGCCSIIDVNIGWRRDNLNWKTKDLCSSYLSADVDDKLYFKNINSYTIGGQAKWVSEHYYVRISGEYGLTDKGRAHEHFNIKSSDLFCPLDLDTSDRIKRKSEVYDFSGAVGYPFWFYNCRFTVIPLIGFSFHRQHLRVKESDESSSGCSYPSPDNSCEFFNQHSSDSFFVDSSNDFRFDFSSNPFADQNDSNIARNIGLKSRHRTDTYRFTWYGCYIGADLAYACDGCWTLFWNTEFHLLDNCHRKRKSWTGVFCVDDYHETGGAYGFNNIVGVYASIANRYFTSLSVDFSWWKGHSRNDQLIWKKVGAKLGFAYAF